jgi:hypothetical protein
MKSIRFLPYEELSIRHIQNNEYVVETPWLSLKIEIDANSTMKQTLSAFEKKEFDKVNYESLSLFLEQMKLPFYYIIPSQKSSAEDGHANHVPSLPIHVSKKEFRKMLGLPDTNDLSEWQWDQNAILEFSKLADDQHSPESILSVVRRFHLLDCAENDKTGKLYNFVKNAQFNSSELDSILATIIYQNYYVTAECQNSLKPALAEAQNSKSALENFMQDEEGHDLLMLRALNSLNQKPENLFLAPATTHIMQLLKKSGEVNFLSFCLAVDFFEKPNFDQIDPLGDLLAFFGKTIAANCLQKHKNINDGGEHDAIALDLLAPMKAVSAEYAITAICIAEVLSDEMTSVTSQLLNLFNESFLEKNA